MSDNRGTVARTVNRPMPRPTPPVQKIDPPSKEDGVGVFGPSTISKLNTYLEVDAGDSLTPDTWTALGKKLGLLGPFKHTAMHNRTLQRFIGTPVGTVTGEWFDRDTKTFDPRTTQILQEFLNEQT